MKYHPDFHHRQSMRLKSYDYSQDGMYFITLCTYQREYLFGEIANNQMQLNELGNVVHLTWNDLPNHNAHIELDAFVVMPNHIHGIISIVGAGSQPAQTNLEHRTGLECRAGLEPAPTKETTGLSEIVRQLKTFSSRRINEIRGVSFPVWQRNYYEHVIRNETSLQKIREYITNNPHQWEADEENPMNWKNK